MYKKEKKWNYWNSCYSNYFNIIGNTFKYKNRKFNSCRKCF